MIIELPVTAAPHIRFPGDLIGRSDGVVDLHRRVGMEKGLPIRVHDSGLTGYVLVRPARWPT